MNIILFAICLCAWTLPAQPLQHYSCVSGVIHNGVISAQRKPLPKESWISSPAYLYHLAQSERSKGINFCRLISIPTDLSLKLQTKNTDSWDARIPSQLQWKKYSIPAHLQGDSSTIYQEIWSICCSRSPETFTPLPLSMFRLKQQEMQNKISLTLQ